MGVHLVNSGDTVWSIANKYGVSPQSIIEANGLLNSVQLFEGWTLFVPMGKMDRWMKLNEKRVESGPVRSLSVQRNTLISVVLFWEPAYDNAQVSGYYILRNNIPIGYTVNQVFVDNNIKIGETYEYKITSYYIKLKHHTLIRMWCKCILI